MFRLVACGLGLALGIGAAVAQTPAQRQAAAGFFDEAWRLREAGDHRGAVGRFQQGLGIARDAQAFYFLGRSLEQLGETRAARDAYAEAVRTDRQSQHGIMAGSEIGRLDRAIAEARQASLRRLSRFALEVVTDPAEIRRLTETIRQSTAPTNCLVWRRQLVGVSTRAQQIKIEFSQNGEIQGIFRRYQSLDGSFSVWGQDIGTPHVAYATVRQPFSLTGRYGVELRMLSIVAIPENVDSERSINFIVVAEDGLRPVARYSLDSLVYTAADISRASPDCS
jgi:hypothetical protein